MLFFTRILKKEKKKKVTLPRVHVHRNYVWLKIVEKQSVLCKWMNLNVNLKICFISLD